jgi:alanine dehydrogenase
MKLVHQDPNQDVVHHTIPNHPDVVVVESTNTRTGQINFHLASYNAITDKWYRQDDINKFINIE